MGCSANLYADVRNIGDSSHSFRESFGRTSSEPRGPRCLLASVCQRRPTACATVGEDELHVHAIARIARMLCRHWMECSNEHVDARFFTAVCGCRYVVIVGMSHSDAS